MSEVPKKITIKTDSKCDYCSARMKYAGANKEIMKVRRACEKHREQAQQDLKKEKEEYENNKTQS